MIQDLIILLLLLKLNLFKGWFLALWIIEVIIHTTCNLLELLSYSD